MAQTDATPRRNLSLVKELGDRAAQGRAYGNLGNTHYLLGSFMEATAFHKEVSPLRGSPSHLALSAPSAGTWADPSAHADIGLAALGG